MNCADVSKELVGYLNRKMNPADGKALEEHLVGCLACQARTEEFRSLSVLLEEVPSVEPSFGFDARVRQRVGAEPAPRWFDWVVPQPRLAFALVLLLVAGAWMDTLPQLTNAVAPAETAASENEQFQAIKDLGVLDNYEVLTAFDALSELTPPTSHQPEKPPQNRPPSSSHGGA